MGVYVVELKKDIFRDIIGPSYFLKLGKEQQIVFLQQWNFIIVYILAKTIKQNVAQFINYNTIIEKLSKEKNIEQKYRKKMAHSLKYLVNPTHKILRIKILLFGCLPMKIVQMLSMVH